MNKTLRFNSNSGPSRQCELSSSEKIVRDKPSQVSECKKSSDSHVYIKSKDHEWVPAVLQKALKTYKGEIDQLEKNIEEVDDEKAESLSSLKNRLETVKDEQKDYEKKVRKLDKDVEKGKEIIDEKKEEIEENKTAISKLKQDHKRLSKVHEKIQKKHMRLSMNNEKLESSTKKGSSMFTETFPGASNVFGKYDEFKDEEEIVTTKNKKLNSEVKIWQDEYWKKASARLEIQRGLGKILSLIQNNSNNQKLIEKTQIIGLKCEKQNNKIMEKVDAEFESSNAKVVDGSSYKP